MPTRAVKHNKYTGSPIEEAVCEFEFPERVPDIRLMDRIHDGLRVLYPSQSKPPAAKIMLSTSDEKSQVHYNERELSIHESGVYPGWVAFRDRIHQALRVFLEAATPPAVSQINIRYRNKIVISAHAPLIANYFTLGATIPHGLPTRYISFVTGVRSVYEGEPRTVLSLSFAATPRERGGLHTMEANLDIMTSKVQLNEPAVLAPMLETLEDLHAKASDAFEKVITDHTRRLFG